MGEQGFFSKRRQAFGFALKGVYSSFRREVHMRVHWTALILVTLLGWYCSISSGEWWMVLACSALVMIAELFNSAIEKICDLVHPAQHPLIGYIKDISSAAVLIACLLAVVTGAMVFIPRLI